MSDRFAVWRCAACHGFLVLPTTGSVSYQIAHAPPGVRWQGDGTRPADEDIVCHGPRELVDRPAVLAAHALGGPIAVAQMVDPDDPEASVP